MPQPHTRSQAAESPTHLHTESPCSVRALAPAPAGYCLNYCNAVAIVESVDHHCHALWCLVDETLAVIPYECSTYPCVFHHRTRMQCFNFHHFPMLPVTTSRGRDGKGGGLLVAQPNCRTGCPCMRSLALFLFYRNRVHARVCVWNTHRHPPPRSTATSTSESATLSPPICTCRPPFLCA